MTPIEEMRERINKITQNLQSLSSRQLSENAAQLSEDVDSDAAKAHREGIFDRNIQVIDMHVGMLFQPFIKDVLDAFKSMPMFSEHYSSMQDSISTNIGQRLKPIVFHLLDKELKAYLKEKNIKVTGLSAVASQQYFIEFINFYKEGHESLINALIAKNNPQLKELCDQVTAAYIDSLIILNRRIDTDIANGVLKRFFEATTENNNVKVLTLTGISPSESAPHHTGQQVLKLTFNVDGVEREMVYKPSTVEIDAKITGNSKKLSQVLRSHHTASFFDLINDKLPAHELPTYLIVPRFDPDGNKIGGGYGYSEFLSHKPWYDLDVDTEARNFFRQFAPYERDKHFGEFQSLIDTKFNEALERGKKDVAGCDYITDKQSDVEKYSYLCGAYGAAMCALGISDMYVENVIISNKKPYLIDLGAALNISASEIDGAMVFNRAHGAFLDDTRAPVRWSCFLDAGGELSSSSENKVEKNRFYMQDKLEPCRQVIPELYRGFQDIVDIICKNKDEFINYTESLADTPVRVIAISKAEMYEIQDRFIKSRFSPESIDFNASVQEKKLRLLSKFEQNPDSDCHFKAYSSQYLQKELSNGSFAVFYAKSNSRVLYDCKGEEILQTLEMGNKSEFSEGDIRQLGNLMGIKYKMGGDECSHINGTPPGSVRNLILAIDPAKIMSDFDPAKMVSNFKASRGVVNQLNINAENKNETHQSKKPF